MTDTPRVTDEQIEDRILSAISDGTIGLRKELTAWVGQLLRDRDDEAQSQVATIAELRAEVDLLKAGHAEWKSTACEIFDKANARADAAEAALAAATARLEKLKAALEQIAESSDTGRGDGQPEPCAALEADAMWAIANEALAALQEDKRHG